jgi:hypothetical protein
MSKTEILSVPGILRNVNPAISVLQKEYDRLLGYPKEHVHSQRSLELITIARNWYAENGRPWVFARRTYALGLNDGKLVIEGSTLASPRLYSMLKEAEAHAVFLVAVSAGKECEEEAIKRWKENKPDEYFFLEMFGSAVVENLVQTTGARFCAWADNENLAILPHYSPGYPDWDILDQEKLLGLIRKDNTALPGNIQVFKTGMLNPKKSLLAVFGITKQVEKTARLTNLVPCESCSLPACKYRRKPYIRSITPIEDVSRLQGSVINVSAGIPVKNAVLDTNARYTLGERVMEKWAKERLQLSFNNDDTIEARFRYDGTTCSNTGIPLTFDFTVKLASKAENHKILIAKCIPAEKDTGHKSMCEYIRRQELFINIIAGEKPMVSKPLSEVISWKRINSPAGCFCNPLSRLHKWGIVYEVIHYALVQLEGTESQSRV